eukprot:sb/3469484/
MTSDEGDEDGEGGERNGGGGGKEEQHFLKYKLPTSVKSPGTEFRCSRCLSKFVSKGTLKRHNMICMAPEKLKSTSSSEDSGAENTPSEYSTFLPLKCNDCKKRFATEGNLNRHMKLSRRCGKGGESDEGESCEREVRKLLSTSLPAYLPTQQPTTGDGDESPTSQISCTFCGSEFASEKTYNVHIRKFRCKRRCKICDFTSGKSTFFDCSPSLTIIVPAFDKKDQRQN